MCAAGMVCLVRWKREVDMLGWVMDGLDSKGGAGSSAGDGYMGVPLRESSRRWR